MKLAEQRKEGEIMSNSEIQVIDNKFESDLDQRFSHQDNKIISLQVQN